MQIKFYSTLTADFFPTDPTDLGSSYKESEGIPYTGEELTATGISSEKPYKMTSIPSTAT